MEKKIADLQAALRSFEACSQQWTDSPRVTVIIPVYNAPQDVAACITSVCRSAGRFAFHVAVADDVSTDLGIHKVLKVLDESTSSFLSVYRNETNMGFAANCNAAMARYDGDVILLNSDTLVGLEWVERLSAAADSSPIIASVTPWSNNGYARLCEEEEWLTALCDRVSVNTIQHFLSRDAGRRQPPRLVTAIGSCMYIKRCVLNDIGAFDEEAFPKGYGEETDWCMRATHKGYIHALATDVFVFHRQGASFKSEREKLLKNAYSIINQRHPLFYDAVKQTLTHDPLALERNEAVIRIVMGLSGLRTSVLIATDKQQDTAHDFWSCCCALQEEFFFYELRYNDSDGAFILQGLTESDRNMPAMRFRVPRYAFADASLNPSQPEHYNALQHLLSLFAIKLVHVEGPVPFRRDLAAAAHSLGIPSAFSFVSVREASSMTIEIPADIVDMFIFQKESLRELFLRDNREQAAAKTVVVDYAKRKAETSDGSVPSEMFRTFYNDLLKREGAPFCLVDLQAAWHWARGVMAFAFADIDGGPTWRRRYERIERNPVTGILIRLMRKIKNDSTI